MALPQSLSELESNPNFASLSYGEQQQVRQMWAQQVLANDEEFQKLGPREQMAVATELITREPVFGRQQQTQYVRDVIKTASGVKQGAGDAEKESGWHLLREGALRRLGPVSKGIANFALDIAADTGMVKGDTKVEDLVTTSDAERKAYDYLKFNMMENPETAPKIRMEAVGMIGGTFADLAVNWGLLKGAGAIAGAAGAGFATGTSTGARAAQSALFMKRAPKFVGSGGKLANTKFGRYMHQSLIPFVTQAGRDATLGVVQQATSERYEGRPWKEAGFGHASSRAAATFGEWFVGDMIFFGGLQVAGTFFKNTRNVFRRGGLRGKAGAFDEMTPREAADALDRFIVQGERIPGDVWETIPDTQRARIQKLRGEFNIAKRIDNYEPGSDEWNTVVAKARNADLEKLANGRWRAKLIVGADGAEELVGSSFTSSKNALRAAVKRLDKNFETKMSELDEIAKSGAASDVVLRETLTGIVKKVELDEAGIVRMFKPDIETGKLHPGKVKAGVQNFLRRTADGAEVNNVEVRTTKLKDYWKEGSSVVEPGPESIVVKIPSKIRTPDEHIAVFRRTFSELDGKVPSLTSKARAEGAARLISKVFPEETMRAGFSPAWAKYTAKQLYGDGASITRGKAGMTLRVPGQAPRTFNSMRELGEGLYDEVLKVRPFTEDELRTFLKAEHGITLAQKGHPDGRITYQAVRNNKVLVDGDFRSAQEFIDRAGRITDEATATTRISDSTLRPKLPVDMAPLAMVVDNGLQQVSVQNRVVRGPMSKIYEFAEQFSDYKRMGRMKRIQSGEHLPRTGHGGRIGKPGSTIDFEVRSKQWEVYLPEYGHRKVFSSIKQAREFANKATRAPDEMAMIAAEKGGHVTFANGQYLVQHVDPTVAPKVARNAEELKSVIRELPTDPSAARELTGLSDATVQAIREELSDILPTVEGGQKFFSDGDFIKHVRSSRGGKARKVFTASWYRPADAQFKEMARYLGRADLYENVYRGMVKAAEQYRGKVGVIDEGLTQVFRGIGEQRLNTLSQFMEIEPGAGYARWYEFARGLENFELQPRDIDALLDARKLLTDWGEAFGVDSWKFINDYLPKIRRYVNSAKFNPGDNGYDVMRKALGLNKKLPKEAEFFARHLRAFDVEAIAKEWNLKEILRMYGHKGVKNQTMDAAFETARDWLSNNIGLFQSEQGMRMFQMNESFLSRMMGLQMTDVGEATMRGMSSELAEEFASALSKGGFKRTAELTRNVDDMISLAQTLSVASLMAFRPYLPIRNMMQIWTTLAPRVGNEVVLEAWKRVAKNPEEVMNRVMRAGTVSHRSPILDVVQAQKRTPLSQFTEAGMVPFRNSDDMTRAVVYESARLTLGDASARFAKGGAIADADVDQFVKMSNIDVLDPIDQRKILTTINEQGLEAGEQEFARILTNETMFPYRRAENPELFQNIPGRVFGHFGHYSVNFLENVRRMLQYNPTKTMGTLALNTTALIYAFEKTMGISAYSFRPLRQMFFTGGPLYTAFNNTLTTMAGGWQATRLAGESPQDRAKFITEQWSRILVPGSMRLYNARRAAEFISNGDYYEGIMRLMSFPMIDPDLKE